MFNKLSVFVLLIVEVAFHYLEKVTKLIVDEIFGKDDYKGNSTQSDIEILNAITKPFSKLIIQLDKDVLNDIATNKSSPNATLIKHTCSYFDSNGTKYKAKCNKFKILQIIFSCYFTLYFLNKLGEFLLEGLNWDEWAVGLLLLFISLALLCFCLIMMVKVLSSIFKGKVALVIQRMVNSDFPGFWRHFNSLVSILIGCGLTVIIQSSSVFISCLVPLVGMGMVELDRVFPLALGANIGTTITGILAALSSPSDSLKDSLQIAFCHTLFNITGILIWFPLPFMRQVPLWLSKTLGILCGEYRWFAIFYLVFVFLFIPLVTFGLSLAGTVVFLCVMIPFLVLIAAVIVVNVMQNKAPRFLPLRLRSWEFLPLWLRSLQPYDKFFSTYICFCRFNKVDSVRPTSDDEEIEIVTMKKEEMNPGNLYKF